MLEWFLGYGAGKFIDAVLGKFNERRKQKRLGEATTRTQDRDLSRQVSRIDVKVRGIDHKLDALLKGDVFPEAIRVAIAEPDLRELSELMKTRQAHEALAYAEQHIKDIDVALENDDPEGSYAAALRTHRQRLLFAAATAASWQGDIEAGRTFWRCARDLGSIDSEWHEQAAVTLFNIELKDELRHLVANMDQESVAYRKSAPLLAYLDENWPSVDELLIDARRADLLLMRVQARLLIIDPKDAKAVQITAELIDRTDDDVILPIVNVTRARLTLELLQLVIRGYTPLDYNRRPLIDHLVRRINVALEVAETDSLIRAQALGCLGIAAELLRDDELSELFNSGVEALEETIRSSVFFLRDPALTPDKIDALLTDGHVSIVQAAILKAELYQASEQPEEVERALREALFATPGKRQRADILRLLTRHLRQANRIDEVQRLIEATPLRPADRWLLRSENLPAGKTPLDLADEVEAFPLDVNVIERLAQSILSSVTITSPEDSEPDSANLELAEDTVRWTTRLLQVLPCRSSRLLHAKALFAARHYNDLLAASRELDPAHSEYAAELEAWALVGLGQRAEGAEVFITASEKHPETEHFTVNAAALLLAEGRFAEAVALFESRVTTDSSNPDILVSYALAIRAVDPGSREEASRAFDLLARAYDLGPNHRIAGEAWKAARTAGRELEGRRFFAAMVKEASHATVNTADDIIEVIRTSENRVVQFDENLEALAELVQKDKERSDLLSEFLSAHVLAYVDFFRHSGRSWELWAYWNQQFERRSSEGETSPGDFSVLADWPSVHQAYDRRHDAEDIKLFLDQTAILTLGVLGTDTAEQILTALGTCYISAGTLEGMRQDLKRINGHLLTGGAAPYTRAVDFLRQRPGAVVSYSEEVESAALNDPGLGPCRVDLGVAILHNARYVTDLDNSKDWSEDAKQLRLSSVTLLASLNAAGEVTVDEARNAADNYPSAFEGWDTATSRPIPKAIVFDEYSILDWVDSGLADVLSGRVTVGPWAWMYISDEVARQQAMELAGERLQATIGVLQSALAEGAVIEVEAMVDGDTHVDAEDIPEEGVSPFEKLWSGALRSLRLAQAYGFQLWSDDRFYALLLRLGGPVNIGPEIQAIREPFVAWAEEIPPISTAELLSRLSSAEHLTSDVAQGAAAKLFTQGYRMRHPLLLAHALRQYPVPTSGLLTPPFQKLVSAITEIPRYLPKTFDDFYRNRDGFIRVASMGVAERFIVGVWEAERLSYDQRYALANAFLEAVEHVFEEASPKAVGARSDRTPIIFWQGVAYALQMMPAQDERRFELRYAALCWLGKAAASRAEQREDIVRVLEDNVLDSLKYALKALEGSGEEDRLSQVIATFVIPALIPLTDTDLINTLDPLMRRTVGTVARLNRDGRITKLFYATADRDGTPLRISEEENEQAAAEALKRAVTGDPVCGRFIKATDLVFTYTRPAPKEWTVAGFPTDEQLPIDVKCSLFTLLWADPPGLREVIVRLIVFHLSSLDPALAYRILEAEDDLLSNDTERVREARDRLAIDVLRSGYSDLQRDLVHAVRRFSQYETDDFAQFVGWIGEEAAQALANQPLTAPVQQIGPLLVPMAHFLGRALLTDGFDDGARVLKHAEQLIDADNDPDDAIANLPTLTEWLADKASLAENADDPFVAAWALRAVLLILATINQNPELDLDGRVVKASDWAASHMAIALAANMREHSELAQRLEDRCQLASAALRLAAFACSGQKHVQAYDQEHDPQAIWLDRVWLLATKLQVTLIGLRGGVTYAAASAATAMRELGLDTSNVPVLDAFDPYAFGSDGDDIGIALTLTAMLKVVRQLPEANERPTWWTDTIRRRVEELVNAGSERALTGDKGLDNRFGLAAPLRIRMLAKKLLETLAS